MCHQDDGGRGGPEVPGLDAASRLPVPLGLGRLICKAGTTGNRPEFPRKVERSRDPAVPRRGPEASRTHLETNPRAPRLLRQDPQQPKVEPPLGGPSACTIECVLLDHLGVRLRALPVPVFGPFS